MFWLKPGRLAAACFPTDPSNNPTTIVCCPPLNQTLSNSEFADGIMTFTYNSNVCRTTVVANCSYVFLNNY